MKHVILTFLAVSFALNLIADDTTLDRNDWTATAFNDEEHRVAWATEHELANQDFSNPANALDGDMNTDWNTLAVQIPGQWIIIDMKAPQTFNQIVMDQTDGTGDYPEQFTVYTSNNSIDWVEAHSAAGVNAIQCKVNIPITQTAQYIKIVQTSSKGGYWKFKELYVNLVEIVNDRFGWTMTASHNNQNAGLTLDGVNNTRWEGGPQNNEQWIILDMKTSRTFNQIILDQNSSDDDYPRNYSVYVSNDGSDWGNAVSIGNGKKVTSPIAVLPAQTARYIKIVNNANPTVGNYWGFYEIYVQYNPYESASWIISAYNNNDKAHLMADGLVNARWDSGDVLDGSSDEFITIDLGKERSFNQIILDQSGANGDFPPSYAIYVSNDPDNFGSIIKSGDGSNAAATVIQLDDIISGRYIKIAQTGNAERYWSIYEIDIKTPVSIAAGASQTYTDYIANEHSDILFIADDVDGTGQLTDIPVGGLQVNGVVKLQKTVQAGQWYSIGFPFEIANISIKQGANTYTGVIYNEDNNEIVSTNPAGIANATDDNIYLAAYDGVNNKFKFTDAIEAGKGYVFEIPEGSFTDGAITSGAVEITFTSEANPTIYSAKADFTADASNYTLAVNPSVADITAFDGSNLIYYQYNNANQFPQTELSNVAPFEAVVIYNGDNTPNRTITIVGDLTRLPEINNEIVTATQYYNLQGMEIAQPQVDQIYLVKKTFESGTVSVSIIIWKTLPLR
jgi:allantoicase